MQRVSVLGPTRSHAPPLEVLLQEGQPRQGIRLDDALVDVQVVVVLEEIVPRHHVLHAGLVQLRYQPEPDRELVRPEVVLDARFHA